MEQRHISPPAWTCEKAGKSFHRVDVARTNFGSTLALPFHVVVGKKDGPTLGVTATVHGDETLPAYALRKVIDDLDTSSLCGRLVIVSVANPLAFNAFSRQSPELHGDTDLFEVFPGKRAGNLTNRIASILSEQLIDQVDAFVDFHAGGAGGRIQYRLEYDPQADPQVRDRSVDLCRAFGIPVIHENSHHGSPVNYANTRGIPAILAELGGPWLGPNITNPMIDDIRRGLTSIMASLGMLHDPPRGSSKKILLIPKAARIDVDPVAGGFLVSNFERVEELGSFVSSQTKLGELVDLYTYKTVQEMAAPVDAYLFFSRYSGQVEAGNKGFALAKADAVKWIV